MKQKIVIEVPMCPGKCRSKAMQAAAAMDGVSSVTVESETNKMVVIGDEVDLVRLTHLLRKKFVFAKILTVEEVAPAPDTGEAETAEEVAPAPAPAPDTGEAETQSQSEAIDEWRQCCNGHYPYQYPQNYICYTVSDAGSYSCSIM